MGRRVVAAAALAAALGAAGPLPAVHAETRAQAPVKAQKAQAGGEEFDGALLTPAADAEHEARLVQIEDQRLIDIRIAAARRKPPRTLPYRVRSTGFDTLVLPARAKAYTLDDLRRLAPESLLQQRDGSYLLREHVLVDVGATLTIAPKRPTTIRMLSASDGFTSLVTHGGRLQLLGTEAAPLRFTSWDQTDQTPDTTVTDGRAYILAEGQLRARYVDVENLGFWSGRTGGLAIASSAEADAAAESSPAFAADSTDDGTDDAGIASGFGSVSDTTLTGNAFGFFATGTAGLSLSHLTIKDSLVDGLVLHRDVTQADVEQVLVEGSGADGVVVTRGVEDALLTRVTSRGNGRDGVAITGKSLAAGPSPSGASVRQFGNNVLRSSLVQRNGRSGVRVAGGTHVQLEGNRIEGGVQGILVADGASAVGVMKNQIVDVEGSGIQVRDADRISVSANTLAGDVTGIHVLDADADVTRNTVTRASLHAVTLVGDVDGTEVTSNLLGGQGSSAIDVARVVDSTPVVKANDVRGWDRTLTRDVVLSAVEHPLTAIWLVVGIMLIIGQVVYRRRHRSARRPYVDGPARTESSAAIEADQLAALRQVLTVAPPATHPATHPAGGPTTNPVALPAVVTVRRLPAPSPEPARPGPTARPAQSFEPPPIDPELRLQGSRRPPGAERDADHVAS